MNTGNTSPRHPAAFFVLVYAMSTPFWILSTFTSKSGLPGNIPPTDIGAALTPTIAAMILSYCENGASGIKALLQRTFDFRRIKQRRWLITAALLFPLLYVLTYYAMRLISLPVPSVWHPSPALGAVFLLFFIAATAEELGYTAYETDALQPRMSALSTSLIIGTFWALWHFPSMIQMGQSAQLMVWGFFVTIAFRIISIWIYNNAGCSVFSVILMHAVGNTAITGFPGGRSAYEIGHGSVAYSIVILTALLVVVLWGSKTLSEFIGNRQSATGA